MNVFDFAMEMEKDGEAYYRDLAGKTEDKGLITILTMMADEEVKHYNLFKQMNEGHADMAESVITDSVKNIFNELSAKPEELSTFGIEAVDAYRKAQEVEKLSEDMYKQKAAELTDQNHIDILNRIAHEERKHWLILQNMIEMIEKPNYWVENAEWRNPEEF